MLCGSIDLVPMTGGGRGESGAAVRLYVFCLALQFPEGILFCGVNARGSPLVSGDAHCFLHTEARLSVSLARWGQEVVCWVDVGGGSGYPNCKGVLVGQTPIILNVEG